MLWELLNNEIICIDIRHRRLKYTLSQYDKKSRTIIIKKYGTILFTEDLLGSSDLNEKIEVLKKFFVKEGIKTKSVYLNISDPASILRIVKVPQMKDKELIQHLEMEIEQYMPVDLASTVIDYKILDTFVENDQIMMNIMITALSASALEFCFKLFKDAGLDPLVVDLYPNAIAKLFANAKEKTVAIIDVNFNTFDFEIISKNRLFMYSNVVLEKNLNFESIEDKDIYNILENDEIFKEVLEQLINYCKTYMEFYSSRHHGDKVETVHIIGNLAVIDKVSEYFTNALKLPIETGLNGVLEINIEDSISSVLENKRKYLNNLSMYSCTLGLAMRGGVL